MFVSLSLLTNLSVCPCLNGIPNLTIPRLDQIRLNGRLFQSPQGTAISEDLLSHYSKTIVPLVQPQICPITWWGFPTSLQVVNFNPIYRNLPILCRYCFNPQWPVRKSAARLIRLCLRYPMTVWTGQVYRQKKLEMPTPTRLY